MSRNEKKKNIETQSFYSAFRYILDQFCFALRLIQAPNKRAGYQLVDNSPHNDDVKDVSVLLESELIDQVLDR